MSALHAGLDEGFDRLALERRFEPLDRMHRRLWLQAIVNTEGGLVARLRGVAAWRERLLAGRGLLEAGGANAAQAEAPRGDAARAEAEEGAAPGSVAADGKAGWPGPEVAEAFSARVEALGLPRLARHSEEVTDQVLRSLLWYVDRVAQLAARVGREQAARTAAQAFFDDWDGQRTDLEEVLRVFESLDGVANFARWSEIRGLLRTEAWQSVLRAHERIAQLPALSVLIRRLGRARPGDELETREAAQAPAPVSQREWVRKPLDVELPGAPVEIEGIRRSGDLNRLLASEAAQWRRAAPGNPRRARRLRRMFAARLAEQGLLTYQHRQRWIEPTWVQAQTRAIAERPVPRPRLEAGPLIVCVDTSASMAGGPEQVGKAVVLEAMRTAARERRACLLFAFSGPGDLREFELGPGFDGMAALAGFLSASFHGGTDIVEPIEAALARIETGAWRQADLVIASDGEFGVTAATLERLRHARGALRLRVQGVLIGDRETIGLREVCDDIFWVRDWRRFGDRHGQAEAPVHDKGLTALYFPNASMRPPSDAGEAQ